MVSAIDSLPPVPPQLIVQRTSTVIKTSYAGLMWGADVTGTKDDDNAAVRGLQRQTPITSQHGSWPAQLHSPTSYLGQIQEYSGQMHLYFVQIQICLGQIPAYLGPLKKYFRQLQSYLGLLQPYLGHI